MDFNDEILFVNVRDLIWLFLLMDLECFWAGVDLIWFVPFTFYPAGGAEVWDESGHCPATSAVSRWCSLAGAGGCRIGGCSSKNIQHWFKKCSYWGEIYWNILIYGVWQPLVSYCNWQTQLCPKMEECSRPSPLRPSQRDAKTLKVTKCTMFRYIICIYYILYNK